MSERRGYVTCSNDALTGQHFCKEHLFAPPLSRVASRSRNPLQVQSSLRRAPTLLIHFPGMPLPNITIPYDPTLTAREIIALAARSCPAIGTPQDAESSFTVHPLDAEGRYGHSLSTHGSITCEKYGILPFGALVFIRKPLRDDLHSSGESENEESPQNEEFPSASVADTNCAGNTLSDHAIGKVPIDTGLCFWVAFPDGLALNQRARIQNVQGAFVEDIKTVVAGQTAAFAPLQGSYQLYHWDPMEKQTVGQPLEESSPLDSMLQMSSTQSSISPNTRLLTNGCWLALVPLPSVPIFRGKVKRILPFAHGAAVSSHSNNSFLDPSGSAVAIRSVAVLSDAVPVKIVSGGADGWIKVWEVGSVECKRKFRHGHSSLRGVRGSALVATEVNALAVLSDSSIVSAGSDGYVCVWRESDGEHAAVQLKPGAVFTGHDHSSDRLSENPPNGFAHSTSSSAHHHHLRALCTFSTALVPLGVAVASDCTGIRVFSVTYSPEVYQEAGGWLCQGAQCVQVLRGHTQGVLALCCLGRFDYGGEVGDGDSSSSSVVLASAGRDNKVILWEVGGGGGCVDGPTHLTGGSSSLSDSHYIYSSNSTDSKKNHKNKNKSASLMMRGHTPPSGESPSSLKLLSPQRSFTTSTQPLPLPPFCEAVLHNETWSSSLCALKGLGFEGSLLFCGGGDGGIRVWNIYTECVSTRSARGSGFVRSLGFRMVGSVPVTEREEGCVTGLVQLPTAVTPTPGITTSSSQVSLASTGFSSRISVWTVKKVGGGGKLECQRVLVMGGHAGKPALALTSLLPHETLYKSAAGGTSPSSVSDALAWGCNLISGGEDGGIVFYE